MPQLTNLSLLRELSKIPLNESVAANHTWQLKRNESGRLTLTLYRDGQYTATTAYKVDQTERFKRNNIGKWVLSAYRPPVEHRADNDWNNTVSVGWDEQLFSTFEQLDQAIQNRKLPSIAQYQTQFEQEPSQVIYTTFSNIGEYVLALPITWLTKLRDGASSQGSFFTSILDGLGKGRDSFNPHRLPQDLNPDLVQFYKSR